MRTITAPCTPVPPDDLIAQACANTSTAILSVLAQRHVLVLDVIGFVLP
ncbi:hypothetical protein [Streptomyces stelliscabiei]|uniref:Uncharacterized protein n=1 Tax=Streptomyces stelliscabiei TaxID=146820 RepID=A0A8I0NW56_9ACTN|nr:hypothetical protein [Streptomyces stelliscabiei]MBE1594688.1 hypothetical protein [Streptomyces stelliscabiei]MDX2518972.1 hypothetical protein [Streptomyces stelliscabiei]